MASGTDTLRSIDGALAQAKRQVEELSAQLQVSTVEVMKVEQEEAEHYRALARVRVSDLAQADLLGTLDATERNVAELLERRRGEHAELEQRLVSIRAQHEALQGQRAEHNASVFEAGEKLDALEAEAQGSLTGDPAYQAQLERAEEAEARARRAERKTEMAEADRKVKGSPYEHEPLFMYLWRRGYGTTAYRAGPLTRFLDGWVARLCGYREARPNYTLLTELPERLCEHAGALRATAESDLEALRILETQAATAAGVDAATAELERADSALDELDGNLAGLEAELDELEAQRSDFAGGQDPTLRRATEAFMSTLRGESLRSLMREARQTPTDADDEIVEALIGNQERKHALERPLEQGRHTLKAMTQRVRELEHIRQEFRKRRYDSGSSGFANGAMIGVMLSQFLGGLMNSRDLWGNIEQQQRWQRRRANPSFGSGGFGRGGGIWSGGLPRGRGGLGSGGFRTGGGFGGGGGGFKTGGGF